MVVVCAMGVICIEEYYRSGLSRDSEGGYTLQAEVFGDETATFVEAGGTLEGLH